MTGSQMWIEESWELVHQNNNNWQAWRKLILTCGWYLKEAINTHNGDPKANQ